MELKIFIAILTAMNTENSDSHYDHELVLLLLSFLFSKNYFSKDNHYVDGTGSIYHFYWQFKTAIFFSLNPPLTLG